MRGTFFIFYKISIIKIELVNFRLEKNNYRYVSSDTSNYRYILSLSKQAVKLIPSLNLIRKFKIW